MFSMSCWAIVCAVLVITAKTRDQMMVARVMNCKSTLLNAIG